jgi:virginiamycin B lyase
MVATRALPPARVRRWSVAATTVALLTIAPSVVAAPGDLTSYDVPPGGVNGVAVAADGSVWFTLRIDGAIGHLDPTDGSVDLTPLDPASEPAEITVGTDGSIWFTLQAGNAIGRSIPGGDLVVYALPNDGSGPSGIAAGPDGSIWFTERFGNRLGRLSPDGTLSEWSTPNAGPAGITVADDGTVWFAAQGTSKLMAFDPATEGFTVVDLPAVSQPSGVALDGDGDVWVTLRSLASVARLDTSTGEVSTIGLTAGGRPTGIAAAADGGMWIAETMAGRLTRVDPETEHVASVDLGPTAPQLVASDPAGFVWVSEAQASRLSSVEVVVAPQDTTPPTIDLVAPHAGSWTAPGVPLVADYACADEGGSGLASCAGTTADGAEVAPGGPGAHPFEVVATDGAGNTASASASYLAFTSVSGSALGGTAKAGAGLTLSLGMDLALKAETGIAASSSRVDCATGEPLGAPEVAEIRDRVANRGTLELRWSTSRSWDGTCRALTLGFDAEGWSGATATFGTVSFPVGSAAAAKR